MQNRIKELRLGRGLTQEALAKLIGTDKSQIRRLENGERRLTTDWMVRIASALGLGNIEALIDTSDPLYKVDRRLERNPAALFADLERIPSYRIRSLSSLADLLERNIVFEQWPAADQANFKKIFREDRPAVGGAERYISQLGPSIASLNRQQAEYKEASLGGLPIYSIAREQSLDTLQQVGTTRSPENLFQVPDAYAIYNPGPLMEPRYKSGWLLYVNPHKPAAVGRDVVVYHKSLILIAELAEQKVDRFVVSQLNPKKDIVLKNDEVGKIHLIVGSLQD